MDWVGKWKSAGGRARDGEPGGGECDVEAPADTTLPDFWTCNADRKPGRAAGGEALLPASL